MVIKREAERNEEANGKEGEDEEGKGKSKGRRWRGSKETSTEDVSFLITWSSSYFHLSCLHLKLDYSSLGRMLFKFHQDDILVTLLGKYRMFSIIFFAI